MCIYDISSRTSLMGDLVTGLHDVYDPDMIAIFKNVLEKLETITDDDFMDIGFYLTDDFFNDFDETEV